MAQMEQFDIFELMGTKPELSEKKDDKKNSNSKKTTTTKSNSTKKVDENLKLPVTVYTGYCEPRELHPEDFLGKNEITLKEAQEFLAKEFVDYPTGISVLQKGKGNVLYLVHKNSYQVGKNSIHVNKDTIFTLANTSFDISAIKTAEECDIECKDLEAHFKSIFNKFGKVGFIHSAISNVIVPTFNFPLLNGTIDFPVTVGVFGREDITITREEYQEFVNNKSNPVSNGNNEDDDNGENEDNDIPDDESTKSVTDALKADKDVLIKIISAKYPDFGEGHLELQWNKDFKMVVAKMVEKKLTSNNKEEESYPTNARLSFLYTQIQLTPNIFGGKETVSKDELIEYVEKDRPEFSKERTNVIYDKGKNLIIMLCIGSRKGATLISDVGTVMDKLGKDEDVLFDWYKEKEGNLYRVEKTKVSCVIAPKPNYQIGSYKLFLPKVPMDMFYIADEVFKRVYEQYRTEAMMQLYWDEKKEEYFWFFPEQKVSPSACDVVRDSKLEMKYTLIGDFHSHAHAEAYFSGKDNRDEKGFRVFGVFGNYEFEKHSFLLRAGTGGCFVYLNIDEVFTYSDSIKGNKDDIINSLCLEADKHISLV